MCIASANTLQVSKVNTEGQAANIAYVICVFARGACACVLIMSCRCPTRDCFLMVDVVTAMELLPAGPTKDRYLNLVAKSFVRDNKYYKG